VRICLRNAEQPDTRPAYRHVTMVSGAILAGTTGIPDNRIH
jgi:hypothetical protein